MAVFLLLNPYVVDRSDALFYFDEFSFGLNSSILLHGVLLVTLTVVIPIWLQASTQRQFALRTLSWLFGAIYWLWLVMESFSIGRSDATIPTAIIGVCALFIGAVAMVWLRPTSDTIS